MAQFNRLSERRGSPDLIRTVLHLCLAVVALWVKRLSAILSRGLGSTTRNHWPTTYGNIRARSYSSIIPRVARFET
ncbi:hypothetical protein K504DRAFT_192155 [Pleomassaria siparia CBS 279.74]|uniref:Uncharacterized protein n=1 Tax=Pleomassaria siparia CBS 279.74 TaxID=1314801 RepID=A0A6G1KGG7_9PLEO|nr:hypothetical protein K504DRAFT_192155 [Pleomassaria siparia CBS 279.74]